MEKRIRKILKKYDINTYNWKLEITREITALIQSEYVEKEFVEWLKDNSNPEFDYDSGQYAWLNYYKDEPNRKLERMSSDEVHDYWIKEVKRVK